MSSTTHAAIVYTSSSLINMLPSEPSICVPRIYMNIEKERVHDVFTDLFGLNAIDRVDMIERTNKGGDPYKRAFVHFKFWPRTEQATEVRLKLLNGEEVKVVYDQPWYWRISASRLPRPEVQVREKELASRPYIMIDETEMKTRTAYDEQQHHSHSRNNRPSYNNNRHSVQSSSSHQQQRSVNNNEGAGAAYQNRRGDNNTTSHDDSQYHVPRQSIHHNQSHYQTQSHPSRQKQQRRFNDYRPPHIHITPTKEPEIESWVNKVPGAPMKGKKPRLVLSDDDAGAGAGSVAADIKHIMGRGRQLSFDETSGDIDITYAKSPMTPALD